MNSLNYFRILGLLLFTTFTTSSNILFFFSSANFSQKNSVWPLVIALAQNGHNVTFLSPQSKSPISHQNVTDLAPKVLQDMVSSLYKIDRFAQREIEGDKDFDYVGVTTSICSIVVTNRGSDPTLAKLFSKDTSYDLVIVNSLITECGFFIAKYFNAKTVHYSPSIAVPFHYETYGLPPQTGWIPDFHIKFESIPLKFLERVYNAHLPWYWHWAKYNQLSPKLEEVVKPLFLEEVPSLMDLERNVSLVLMNTHMAADFARAHTPLFQDIGGMACWQPVNEIPKNIRDFLDSYKTNGVVLVTFGSTVLLNTVTQRHQAMFFEMVRNFPKVGFLMRWKGPLPNFLEEIPKNLMVSEWLPQREILSHPNLKAFVTHGGISSVHEATFYGVPMIVLPLFSDQDFNAYRAEAQEVGLRVEIRGMTGEILVKAVGRILNDERFRKNAQRKSAIFRDRPQNPIATASFWIEFTLRHNDTIGTMLPGNAHLNTFQIRMLDVYLFDLIIVLIILILVKYVLKFVKSSLLNIAFGKTDEIQKTDKSVKSD